jgi:hypothetical protein
MKPPGRLRHAVAEILSDHFQQYIDPTYVRPATGWYRTSPDADVYRWELSMPGRWLGCWDTMTEFVRDAKKYGIEVRNGEIYAHEARGL